MSEVTFVSSPYGGNFTIVLKRAIEDPRISWRAKGILVGCLSVDPEKSFTKEWIIAHGREGRDAVIAALKELRKFGYLENTKKRNSSGCITGASYRFTDKPEFFDYSGQHHRPENPVSGATENQRPENPVSGATVEGGTSISGFNLKIKSNTKTIKPKTINPRTPHSPPLELLDWLEPYRADLEQWQANRRKAHPKVAPGLTRSTLNGLLYARKANVLEEYCSHASERNWQSLGFIGHEEVINKLAKQKGTTIKPVASEIKYTLQ